MGTCSSSSAAVCGSGGDGRGGGGATTGTGATAAAPTASGGGGGPAGGGRGSAPTAVGAERGEAEEGIVLRLDVKKSDTLAVLRAVLVLRLPSVTMPAMMQMAGGSAAGTREETKGGAQHTAPVAAAAAATARRIFADIFAKDSVLSLLGQRDVEAVLSRMVCRRETAAVTLGTGRAAANCAYAIVQGAVDLFEGITLKRRISAGKGLSPFELYWTGNGDGAPRGTGAAPRDANTLLVTTALESVVYVIGPFACEVLDQMASTMRRASAPQRDLVASGISPPPSPRTPISPVRLPPPMAASHSPPPQRSVPRRATIDSPTLSRQGSGAIPVAGSLFRSPPNRSTDTSAPANIVQRSASRRTEPPLRLSMPLQRQASASPSTTNTSGASTAAPAPTASRAPTTSNGSAAHTPSEPSAEQRELEEALIGAKLQLAQAMTENEELRHALRQAKERGQHGCTGGGSSASNGNAAALTGQVDSAQRRGSAGGERASLEDLESENLNLKLRWAQAKQEKKSLRHELRAMHDECAKLQQTVDDLNAGGTLPVSSISGRTSSSQRRHKKTHKSSRRRHGSSRRDNSDTRSEMNWETQSTKSTVSSNWSCATTMTNARTSNALALARPNEAAL